MVACKINAGATEVNSTDITSAKKRRLRRKKLHAAKTPNIKLHVVTNNIQTKDNHFDKTRLPSHAVQVKSETLNLRNDQNQTLLVDNCTKVATEVNMSSKESAKSRDDVVAAREAKKLAKQKAKNKDAVDIAVKPEKDNISKDNTKKDNTSRKDGAPKQQSKPQPPKCVDEVDKAVVKETVLEKTGENQKDQVLAERAAKKAAKQAKKKGAEGDIQANPDMTVKDVVETLKDIKNIAKDIQDITAKVSAIHIEAKKETGVSLPATEDSEENAKSKAALKAERRAKQEAQRAAKQAATEQKVAKAKTETAKPKADAGKPRGDIAKEKSKSPKPKSDKPKLKPASANRVNWFQHLYTEHDKDSLKKIALNSNLHPAIIKLGVQLASRVVTGSNARCIALLDALKKMVKDYTLPAKTEFARGLEAHLKASLEFLWAMRQPSASQTNAVKYFRHHLTQLPNNIDEFDAKKILQEEIDKYFEDQIDKAGEAISMAVQKKIAPGDNILTYGCSSLIERILREAWAAGLRFRTTVVGDRVKPTARDMLRRLAAAGLPVTYVDITALSFVMKTTNKVLLGAGALLVNGSVLSAAGTAQTALLARAHNVPVLVACETHKFCDRVQTDAFVYNEIGDPDALIDRSDDSSPLKDWRSNPNLTPLNLTYDVTPASLVTAVVTEKAILPCTSAPVVLRTKLTEYGM